MIKKCGHKYYIKNTIYCTKYKKDGGGNGYFVYNSLMARGKKLLWNLAVLPRSRVQPQEQSMVGAVSLLMLWALKPQGASLLTRCCGMMLFPPL